MAVINDRYASTLFEMTLESGALEDHLKQAVLLRERLINDKLIGLLEDPHVPDTTKRELISERVGGRISDDMMGFLRLAIETGREGIIIPTLSSYIEMCESRIGRTMAYVVSAEKLSDEQLETLGALMSRKMNKRVEIFAREDPELIGGFYIRVEGRLIDRTVRTNLRNLKEILKGG